MKAWSFTSDLRRTVHTRLHRLAHANGCLKDMTGTKVLTCAFEMFHHSLENTVYLHCEEGVLL